MADTFLDPDGVSFATSEVVTAAKMQQYVLDNMKSVSRGLVEDISADTDILHVHKTGTLAARLGAAKAGRIYLTTDTLEAFWDNGTIWRHLSGYGAYDDFTRANSTTITPSRSGHAWSEAAGDWQILSNALQLVSGATAVATLDTGARLDRPFRVFSTFATQATQASIDIGVVFKFVDTSNYLYVQLVGATGGNVLRLVSVIAGTTTVLATIAFTPTSSRPYELDIQVYGNTVIANLLDSTVVTSVVPIAFRHTDIIHSSLAAATKIGCRLVTTLDNFTSLNVQF